MSRILDIDAIPEAPRFDAREPVGILITLRNRSHTSIEFDFPFPAPSELSLTSQNSRLRAVNDDVTNNREAVPRRLAPGKVLRTRHELRRFFHLPERGRFDVEVRLDMTIQPVDTRGQPNGPVEALRWQRTLEIIVEPSVSSDIGSRLQQFAQDMRGHDEQRRAEAVEVFAHVGDETALPYLQEAMEVPWLRAEALRGLARLGNAASLGLIEDALGRSDLPTLQVGLSSLSAAGRPIQVETLRALVSSGDPAVQHACLEHLLSVGGREHATVVSALGDNPNSAVAELATSFLARFQ